ncbi:hypothetical protein CJ030_MR5G017518 [Morella rubra]|uniref:Uncharacterized protein n=1 Tax=Morella rubra TaxID=262757 RepID=A0A6A1VQ27_9ROSI|nr:hypothetical protein CJ030_MR5G017518 [Morella rubra]
MDHHKWRALSHALNRDKKHKFEDYLSAVKDIEAEAQHCYEEPLPKLKKNEFAKIMLLDGCFVIELLRGATEGFKELGYLQDDPIFACSGSLIHSVQRDMIKLENQLPLFVLDKLLGLQLDESEQKGGVAKLVTGFFKTLMPTNEPLTNRDGNQSESPDHGSLHCLDVFRDSLLRTRWNKGRGFWFRVANTWAKLVEPMLQSTMTFAECFEGEQKFERQQLIHCTTELRDAGIDFKERKTACFWDIKFKKGTLEIPRLLIQDGTKSLLLNLIAFEQCHPNRGNKITSYAVFMDNLINSEQDVAYLQSCGIIKNWLGSDAEVAKLFNGLGQEVVFDRSHSYLSGLSKDLNHYYGRTWNTWRASLKHKYFSNPWAFISFLAAVVLLLLTLLQTFYGVYGYYKPR